MDNLEGGLETTWLGDAVAMLAGLGTVALIAGIVGLVLFFTLGTSFLYVLKGGGQYGIIEGYVGTIGAGKTTLAVQHALMLAKARDALILSNIPVKCGDTCGGSMRWSQDDEATDVEEYRPDDQGGTVRVVVAKRLHRPLKPDGCTLAHASLPVGDEGIDLETLIVWAFRLRDLERGLVLLMDEVGVVMPARAWKDFSVALMWLIQQSRKLAAEWIWTAQDVNFVDSQLRSLTAVVHYVRSYPPPSIWRRMQGKRPWALIASAYSPANAPRANADGMRTEKRIGRRVTRYRRSWERSFDTDGIVLPSKYLKGADSVINAVEKTGDGHVIQAGASSWGEHHEGSLAPGEVHV